MKKQDIHEFFARLKARNPNPKSDLEYTNDYTLLIAVVLSAQATDIGVNKATKNLFKTVDTPQKMLKLGEAGLGEHIKTIGLFNAKAKNVIALSQRLVDEFGGEVPGDRDVLETLPGVGRKTANVVMNIAFGHPTMAVDTHVFRVANRLGLCKTATPDATEAALEKVVPAPWKPHAHHWLILHGRYICQARKPLCGQCAVSRYCDFKPKTP